MAASKHEDIDSYIASCREDVRDPLNQIRAVIRRAAPDAIEAIKYGIPTFVLGENLVHFAAFRNHIGFYPSSSGIAAFAAQLSRYKSAKGSVQFPLTEPVPLGLIERIVLFRVGEAKARAASRRKP